MEQTNILVVIDTQNDFCDGSLGTKEAQATVPNIVNKIEAYGEAGCLIFTTQDTHTDNYLNTREGEYLPVEHCIIGTKGHDIVPAIQKALSEYVHTELIKYTFGSEQLADCIKKEVKKLLPPEPKTPNMKEIQPAGKNLTIMLVGWCTDICVLANAILLKTAFPEAIITVDSSCCAGVTPKTHEAALTVMESLQIDVI